METVHEIAVALNSYKSMRERQKRYYENNKEFLKKKRDLKKQGIEIKNKPKMVSIGVQTIK